MAHPGMDWGRVFGAGLEGRRRGVPPPVMLTVAAAPALVPFLLERMAPEQRAKLEAVTGGQGAAQLGRCIEASTLTWCGIDRDGVVTMGGVLRQVRRTRTVAPRLASGVEPKGSPVFDATGGYAWQVATPALALHKRAYIRQGRAWVAGGLAQHGRLTTIIEASLGAALRHAARLGFDVGAPEDMGGTRACRCVCEGRT